MTRLRAPKVTEKLVPVFTSEELSALAKTCQGRCSPSGVTPRSSRSSPRPGSARGSRPGSAMTRTTPAAATSLVAAEITVRGKGGRARVVRIGHEAARALDRYLGSGPGMRRRTGRSCGWG